MEHLSYSRQYIFLGTNSQSIFQASLGNFKIYFHRSYLERTGKMSRTFGHQYSKFVLSRSFITCPRAAQILPGANLKGPVAHYTKTCICILKRPFRTYPSLRNFYLMQTDKRYSVAKASFF